MPAHAALAPARARRPSPTRPVSPRTTPVARPRGRTPHLPLRPAPEPDAERVGVIWLDCCGQPIARALDSLRDLVAELDGRLSVLEETPAFAVAQVRLPRAAFNRFRGAMALAGGALLNTGETDNDAEAVFIVSQA